MKNTGHDVLRLYRTLEEASSLRPDGTIDVKLIAPGWNLDGDVFYPEEVLSRDGPEAWPGGTHMFLDHPSESEKTDRPERSVRDLSAVLVEGARWEAEHAEGPGLYAVARVFPQWQEFVDEASPFIGVSIRAMGEVHTGEREGRAGLIVDRIVRGVSVDFVTEAGAGGKVLQLMESARRRSDELELSEQIVAGMSANEQREALDAALTEMAPDGVNHVWVRDFGEMWVVFEFSGPNVDADKRGPWRSPYTVTEGRISVSSERVRVRERVVWVPAETDDNESEETMAEPTSESGSQDKDKKLEEAVTDLQERMETVEEERDQFKDRAEKAETALLIREASEVATEAIGELDGELPDATVKKLVESVTANPPTTEDGKLDREALTESVAKAAEAELEYLAEATGRSPVRGMGPGDGDGNGDEPTEVEEARIEESFRNLGLSEGESKQAASIR